MNIMYRFHNYFLCLSACSLSLSVSLVFAQTPQPAAPTIESVSLVNQDTTIQDTMELIRQRKFSQAKIKLAEFITIKSNEKIPPCVSDNTLYLYAGSQGEVLALSILLSQQDEKQWEKQFPQLAELKKQSPWTSVVFVSPELPIAHLYLAYIAVEERRNKKALEELETAIQIWPRFEAAYCEWVYLLIGQKQLGKAKEKARFALDHVLSDPEMKCRLLRHLGYIAVEENQLEQAKEYYQECLRLIPNEPKSLLELEYIQSLETKTTATDSTP